MKTKKTAPKPQDTKLLTSEPNGSKPAHEEVATFAFRIWDQQGRTNGHDVDDWLEAERQLEATRA